MLINRLYGYGLSFGMVTFLNLYLKDRKQNFRINNILSSFRSILPGLPQGCILGLIFFNIFLNDLFLCIKKSDLQTYFTDDGTITPTYNNLKKLLKTLEKDSESGVSWLKRNKMIVNADKFQTIILNKRKV